MYNKNLKRLVLLIAVSSDLVCHNSIVSTATKLVTTSDCDFNSDESNDELNHARSNVDEVVENYNDDESLMNSDDDANLFYDEESNSSDISSDEYRVDSDCNESNRSGSNDGNGSDGNSSGEENYANSDDNSSDSVDPPISNDNSYSGEENYTSNTSYTTTNTRTAEEIFASVFENVFLPHSSEAFETFFQHHIFDNFKLFDNIDANHVEILKRISTESLRVFVDSRYNNGMSNSNDDSVETTTWKQKLIKELQKIYNSQEEFDGLIRYFADFASKYLEGEAQYDGDHYGDYHAFTKAHYDFSWVCEMFKKFYENFYIKDQRYRKVLRLIGIPMSVDYLNHCDGVISSDETQTAENIETAQTDENIETQTAETIGTQAEHDTTSSTHSDTSGKKLSKWLLDATERNAEVICDGINILGGVFVKLSQVIPPGLLGQSLTEKLNDCKDKAAEESSDTIDREFLNIQQKLRECNSQQSRCVVLAGDAGPWLCMEEEEFSQAVLPHSSSGPTTTSISPPRYQRKSMGAASIGTVHFVDGVWVNLKSDDDDDTHGTTDGNSNSAPMIRAVDMVVKIRRVAVVENTRLDERFWNFVKEGILENSERMKRILSVSEERAWNSEDVQKGLGFVKKDIEKTFENMKEEFDYSKEAGYTEIAHNVLKQVQVQVLLMQQREEAQQAAQQQHLQKSPTESNRARNAPRLLITKSSILCRRRFRSPQKFCGALNLLLHETVFHSENEILFRRDVNNRALSVIPESSSAIASVDIGSAATTVETTRAETAAAAATAAPPTTLNTKMPITVHAPKIYQVIEKKNIFMEKAPGITLKAWAKEKAQEFQEIVRSMDVVENFQQETIADNDSIKEISTTSVKKNRLKNFMLQYNNDLQEIGTALIVSIWAVTLNGGFIHMDAHSGNIMFDENHRKLTLIDFGMVTNINAPVSAALDGGLTQAQARLVTIREALKQLGSLSQIIGPILSGSGDSNTPFEDLDNPDSDCIHKGPDFSYIMKKLDEALEKENANEVLRGVIRSILTTVQTMYSLCIERSDYLDNKMKEKFLDYYFEICDASGRIRHNADKFVDDNVAKKLDGKVHEIKRQNELENYKSTEHTSTRVVSLFRSSLTSVRSVLSVAVSNTKSSITSVASSVGATAGRVLVTKNPIAKAVLSRWLENTEAEDLADVIDRRLGEKTFPIDNVLDGFAEKIVSVEEKFWKSNDQSDGAIPNPNRHHQRANTNITTTTTTATLQQKLESVRTTYTDAIKKKVYHDSRGRGLLVKSFVKGFMKLTKDYRILEVKDLVSLAGIF